MADTVSLFALHLYVNSAGIRYLPMLLEREFVLLETHAEGDDAPCDLPRALGLERRRAVARNDIELALMGAGWWVVLSLGLDPRAFRLVCVPPDVYMRVGPTRGWGHDRSGRTSTAIRCSRTAGSWRSSAATPATAGSPTSAALGPADARTTW